ncbi:MAG TPA: c-type cytochrome domain-containing protein [Verrucomicrobiae bacterium]
MYRCLAGLAALVSLCAFTAPAADGKKAKIDLSKLPPASTKQGVTYAADVKSIFDTSCVRCHGGQKPKGKLRLDSREGALKGGEDGKVVVPGNSAASILVHNIAQLGDPDFHMPPPKNKANIPPLTGEQIGVIRAWIDQGAK